MRLVRVSLVVALMAAVRLSAQSNSISLTTLGSMTITSATPGGQPNGQIDNSGRYSVSAVTGRMKITAQLDTPLPTGVTLTISLAAPSGAVSLGAVPLGTSSQDAVRYIPVGDYPNLSVTLTLNTSVSAGVVAFSTSHVVLTLVSDP